MRHGHRGQTRDASFQSQLSFVGSSDGSTPATGWWWRWPKGQMAHLPKECHCDCAGQAAALRPASRVHCASLPLTLPLGLAALGRRAASLSLAPQRFRLLATSLPRCLAASSLTLRKRKRVFGHHISCLHSSSFQPPLLHSLVTMPQPVPPSWKDLGKSSSDLLLKDYPINGTSLEVKTLTPSNVAFKVAGTRDSKSNVINGDIEGKYVDFKNGLTVTQAWTTTNLLRTQVELENQIAKGLKLDLATTLNPAKSTKAAVLTAIYKQPSLHTRATADIFKGPTFTADAVVGHDGFLVGAEASYDVQAGAITRYAAALGFSAPEYAVTLHGLGNLSTFAASYYHKVSKDVEAGAKAVYDTKSTTGGVSLEVGAKAYLDNAAFVKAKINNSGVLVLGYTQALRPGVKASFGLALDTTKLNDATAGAAAHKVGASFTFNS